MRIVGAGLPRTGTMSLKAGLERLTGEPCYHMHELRTRPEDVRTWQRAVDGEPVDWGSFLEGYGAAVDWPASAFWRDLADAWPDALVLLSRRDDAQQWWRSAEGTIFPRIRATPAEGAEEWSVMVRGLAARLTPDWHDPAAAQQAYDDHLRDVRATVPPSRLLEWTPADGWEPLCRALAVSVPDEPFPRTNTSEEFRARAGLADR